MLINVNVNNITMRPKRERMQIIVTRWFGNERLTKSRSFSFYSKNNFHKYRKMLNEMEEIDKEEL